MLQQQRQPLVNSQHVEALEKEKKELQDALTQQLTEKEIIKHNLSQTINSLNNCEETLFTQYRLLKIRSELITSMKVSEDENKIKLQDLELQNSHNEACNAEVYN